MYTMLSCDTTHSINFLTSITPVRLLSRVYERSPACVAGAPGGQKRALDSPELQRVMNFLVGAGNGTQVSWEDSWSSNH